MKWLAALWYFFFPPVPEDEKVRELEAEEVPALPEPEPEPEPGPKPPPDSDSEITLPDPPASPFVPVLKPPSQPEPEPEPEEPEIEEPGIRTIGVWAGRSSIRRGQKDIDFCLEHGINRIDLIVNEHSSWRAERDFDTYDLADILDFCKLVNKAGIELHFMSWIMPHANYITQAADTLIHLCEETGAKSLQWDAEEPWTLAKNPMDYESAAELIAEKFENLSCEMGANGIGYTPRHKFGPLAKVCDYIVPQCYSTSTSGIAPHDVVPRLHRRWKKVFNHERHAIGLAAYRQTGIKGYKTVDSAMRTALAGAQALEGVDTVIYWSLASIRRTRAVRNFIKSIEKVE